MFRSHLPRLYELRDLIPDPDSPDAYFQDFEAVLHRDRASRSNLYQPGISCVVAIESVRRDHLDRVVVQIAVGVHRDGTALIGVRIGSKGSEALDEGSVRLVQRDDAATRAR